MIGTAQDRLAQHSAARNVELRQVGYKKSKSLIWPIEYRYRPRLYACTPSVFFCRFNCCRSCNLQTHSAIWIKEKLAKVRPNHYQLGLCMVIGQDFTADFLCCVSVLCNVELGLLPKWIELSFDMKLGFHSYLICNTCGSQGIVLD